MKRTLTDEARAAMARAGKAAQERRWGGRGPSSTVRVDRDVAEMLLTVPVKDRRRVATEGIRRAVDAFHDGTLKLAIGTYLKLWESGKDHDIGKVKRDIAWMRKVLAGRSDD